MEQRMTQELRADLNRLEAVLREELAGQRRMLDAVARQGEAVAARTPEGLEHATRELEGELDRGAARRQRVDTVMRRIASALSVAPSALTLGSLVERLGESGAKLRELREELRLAAHEVADALGYRSEAAFGRAFKRCLGVSPGQARRATEVAPAAL